MFTNKTHNHFIIEGHYLILGQKGEGELCGSSANNCDEGLSCIWDGQSNGVGICSSETGKAIINPVNLQLYNILSVLIPLKCFL